jgi:hypothetical protein
MPDRIEREIEDILSKLDDFVPDKGQKPIPFRKPAKRRNQGGTNWFKKTFGRLTLNQVMLYALIAAIAGFALRGLPLAYWVMIGGLVVLVVTFVMSLRGGSNRTVSGGSYQKRWRGEPIDVRNYDEGLTIGDRIARWFRRRK